jgi:hypothetical protein
LIIVSIAVATSDGIMDDTDIPTGAFSERPRELDPLKSPLIEYKSSGSGFSRGESD